MIISRTPLRISLGGGGTDLPFFYRKNSPGFLVAGAIDKYIYIAVHHNFEDSFLLKYSEIENAKEIEEIRHPMIRAVLTELEAPRALEITSIADIPAGTGLGSSGSFGVGLIKALCSFEHKYVSNHWIAEKACHVEMNILNEPVGKQDQFIAATGGITAFEFHDDESVTVTPIQMRDSDRRDFESSLMLFYTKIRRSASDELKVLRQEGSNASSIMENLEEVRAVGYRAAEALESGELDKYGALLSDQWRLKYQRQPSRVHAEIDAIIKSGIEAGAYGGKLIGAGGGGFILFSTESKPKLRKKISSHGLVEVPITIDYEGSTTIRAW